MRTLTTWTVIAMAAVACDDFQPYDPASGDPDRERGARQEERRDHGNREAANPPFEQGENREDLEITAAIRRAVLDAEDLSMGADNVVIVTRDGRVTLRGTVKDEDEKAEIARIARSVVGVAEVDDQLAVSGDEAQDDAPTQPEAEPELDADPEADRPEGGKDYYDKPADRQD